ncbi:hypothetical protein V8C37DRAFT_238980 [Trichoderma ceciliae]
MATRSLDGGAPIMRRSALLSDASAAAQSTASSQVTGETQRTRMAAQKRILGRWRPRPVSRDPDEPRSEASRPHFNVCFFFLFFSSALRSTTQDYLSIGSRLLYRLAISRRSGSFLRPIPHA